MATATGTPSVAQSCCQWSARSKTLTATCLQVLQTLSIIIQNVRSETGIFFLFSNNHINNIVDLDFDFSDEEVLGYYISFLKTISLKLNTGTVPPHISLVGFGFIPVWCAPLCFCITHLGGGGWVRVCGEKASFPIKLCLC